MVGKSLLRLVSGCLEFDDMAEESRWKLLVHTSDATYGGSYGG
jgi:hypothetical protein